MSELKPCPFCGGEAGLSVHDNHYVVECTNQWCEVGTYTELRYPQSAEAAIEAWNTRHERTCRIVEDSRKYVLSDGTELFEGGCSECGGYLEEGDNYCPSCGARVKEDTDAD